MLLDIFDGVHEISELSPHYVRYALTGWRILVFRKSGALIRSVEWRDVMAVTDAATESFLSDSAANLADNDAEQEYRGKMAFAKTFLIIELVMFGIIGIFLFVIWFITIPFTTYYETVEEQIPSPFPWYDWRQRRPGDHPTYWRRRIRKVRAFLPHFRRATHRHFVLKPANTFRTIILTGPLKRDWGFWPKDNAFIPHREWATYDRDVKPGDRLT